jgi:hypothetical protein
MFSKLHHNNFNTNIKKYNNGQTRFNLSQWFQKRHKRSFLCQIDKICTIKEKQTKNKQNNKYHTKNMLSWLVLIVK